MRVEAIRKSIQKASWASSEFPNVPVLFQWQRAKCVIHCAPLEDAGAQAPVNACLVETTAGKMSV